MICITKFQFLMAYTVTKHCPHHCRREPKIFARLKNEVSTIVVALSEVRSTIDVKHKEWFDTVANS